VGGRAATWGIRPGRPAILGNRRRRRSPAKARAECSSSPSSFLSVAERAPPSEQLSPVDSTTLIRELEAVRPTVKALLRELRIPANSLGGEGAQPFERTQRDHRQCSTEEVARLVVDTLTQRRTPAENWSILARRPPRLKKRTLMDTDERIDWRAWLERWDRQQVGYVPEREERFSVMFDVLDELLPPSFTALDLACGPGSLSRRLLGRFPEARVIAIDFDPVMLALGRGALGTDGGRLRWIDADLVTPEWMTHIGDEEIQAVLSSTALHWLEPRPLRELYRELGRLLKPGGIVLNGDHMSFGPEMPTLARLSDRRLGAQWADAAFEGRGIETAEQWWDALSAESALAPLFAERQRRFAGKTRQESPPGFDTHVASLSAAGFREVGTIWQVFSNRVLLAVR
jgi:SAM-dependent methyltransferase